MQGRNVAYLPPPSNGRRLYQIRLSGPPVGPKVGPSALSGTTEYFIHATWPDRERMRWEALQLSQAEARRNGDAFGAQGGRAKLTTEENQWLKTHYGGEFNFLRMYGLKFGDEDREEGRAIMRAIKQTDDNGDNDNGDDGDYLDD